MVVARIVVQHGMERLNGHGDGRVADGVNAVLPAEFVALFDIGVDLLGREERTAAESRLPFIIDQRPRGGAGETAVGGHFANRSDAQPLVTVAGLAAKLLQLCGALFGMSGFRRVSDLNGRARQFGAVLGVENLPLGPRSGDVRPQRCAGFNHAGDAELELLAHVLKQAVAHVLRFVRAEPGECKDRSARESLRWARRSRPFRSARAPDSAWLC